MTAIVGLGTYVAANPMPTLPQRRLAQRCRVGHGVSRDLPDTGGHRRRPTDYRHRGHVQRMPHPLRGAAAFPCSLPRANLWVLGRAT